MTAKGPLTRVGLGFGANMDDKVAQVRRAIEAVAELKQTQLKSVSSLYHSAPWGDTDQDAFINACALYETALAPHTLLGAIKEIEHRLGRRKTRRWGPRQIDIDILFYGAETLATPELTLPHAHLFERAFVLVPLAEIAGESVISGRRLCQAAKVFDGSEGLRRLPDEDEAV